METSQLIVEIQRALRLSQRELGALVGVHMRTIQRWQGKGWLTLTPPQAEKLAAALRPVRPDLADQVLEIGREFAATLDGPPPFVPATPEQVDRIVAAAEEATGASAAILRRGIAAAFAETQELGLDVPRVLAGLR